MTRMKILSLLLLLIASAGAGPLPPLPHPTTSFGAAVAGDWLYVYGGNGGKAHEFHRESVHGNFLRLRMPAGTEWEPLAGDAALLGSAMAEHEGAVYRIGGLEARNAKGEKNDLHSTALARRFLPAESRWEDLPALPTARSSHDVVAHGGKLYVGGGWNLTGAKVGEETESAWQETVLVLDLAQPGAAWHSIPQPFKRRAIAMVAHADRIWFIGGMDSHDDPSPDVDWYDPRTATWGKAPPLPEGEMEGFGAAACVAGGRLLASPLTGIVWALSNDGLRWEEVTKLAQPRFFHRLLPVPGGAVVVVGGSNRKEQIRDLELISLEQKPAAAADWPQWRGPDRDGRTPQTGWRTDWPDTAPPVLWKAEAGMGMSSPIATQGMLFTHGNDGQGSDNVIARDAATGVERWRHTIPCATAAHEMPIVPNGPGATPTAAAGQLFALTREGDLLCLEAATGKLQWHRDLVADLGGKRPVYGYTQSPLVDGGRVILDIGGTAGSTVALAAATGEVAWRAGTGEAGYSSARVFERGGERLVAMFKGEGLDVFSPADGRVLWTHRTTARDFSNASTPAFAGHRILVSNTGTDPATLLDWDAAPEPNVRPAWSHKQLALLFNSAIEHGGSLFAFNEKRRGHHEFTCVDAVTGETRWVSGDVNTGTFLLAGDHWIFQTREGEIVIAPASLTELKPVARFPAVAGKCYGTPALAAGILYVRNNAGQLAAFDLQRGSEARKQ